MRANDESYVAVYSPLVVSELDVRWNPGMEKYVFQLSEDARVVVMPSVAQRLLGQLLAALIARGDAVDFAQIADMAIVELKTAAAELKWAGEPEASARVAGSITQLGYVAEAVKSE